MSAEAEARDGWILVAIAWAQQNGGTLDAVVEWADVINHAIPLAAEIEDCVNRAIARGVLTIAKDRFVLSEEAKAVLAEAARRMKKLEQCEVAAQYLRSREASSMNVPMWRLDPSRLNEAIEIYRKRFCDKSKSLQK